MKKIKLDSRTTKLTLRQFYRASTRHKKLFLLSFLAPLGNILIAVGLPFFASKTIAALVASDTKNFIPDFVKLSICSLLIIIFNRFGVISLFKNEAKGLAFLSNEIFDKLIYRGINFFQNNIGGKIVSDFADYLVAYLSISNAAFLNGFSFLASIFIGILVIATQSLLLAGFIFLVIFILVVATIFDSIRRSRLRNVRHQAMKKAMGHFSDSIVNAQAVKIFANEKIEIKEHEKLTEKIKNLRIYDWTLSASNGNYRTSLLLLGLLLLFLIIRKISGTNPDLLAAGIFAYTYTFMLIVRLFELNGLTRVVEEALLGAQPMTEILSQQTEVKDVVDAKKLKVTNAHIKFEDVTFAYKDNSGKKIFEKLDLEIKPGEKIGLVGPSGGGKSTLTKVLLRFEDIESGRILIDNQDISQVTQHSLRKSIGFVPQEPILFHRSIADNIGYGAPGADDAAIEHAAKLAYADDFIKTLPNGYDTIVGERGVKLSGGQRQRIAIARTILKESSILVLDEATSALDSESEVAIQAALENLMTDKTTLVIAHRLSTIQRMDRIIVMNEGKIVEDGSHQDLLSIENGLYRRLWDHQSGGFIATITNA